MRNKLKYLLILLIVFLVLLIVVWKGKYSDLEKFESDKGPLNSEELIELQLELRDKMCIEDKYTDLQRIKQSDNPEKEVEYQLRVAKAKLESFGIITSDLEIN